MSYAEQVFIELLGESDTDNLYCVDCGWKLLDSCLRNFLQNDIDMLSDIYVSVNHGIFLCPNCASIH